MTDITVDVDLLRSEIEKTYTQVSTEPAQDFIFPTGRSWAEDLGYPQPELSRVPEATVESFAGVANPYSLGRLDEGATAARARARWSRGARAVAGRGAQCAIARAVTVRLLREGPDLRLY
jgi:hypothetical protein